MGKHWTKNLERSRWRLSLIRPERVGGIVLGVGLMLTLVSCNRGGQMVADPPTAEGGAVQHVAQGPEERRSAGAEPVQRVAEEPPFAFTPRRHAPHHYPGPSPVDFAQLPRLVQRSCAPVRYRRRPPPPIMYAPSPRRGGAMTRAPLKMKRPAPRKPAPPSSAADLGLGSGAKAGNHGSSSGAPAAEAPRAQAPAERRPAPPTSAPRDQDKADAPHLAPGHARKEHNYDFKDDALKSPSDSEEARRDYEPPTRERDDYHNWGASIYLSNDDSMSLSSAQRVIYAIENYRPIAPEHIRPHELLNYFSFEAAPVEYGQDFSVLGEIDEKPGKPGEYSLALSVAGRRLSREERRNATLTVVLDRSGSMSDEGRMSYLKQGLERMTRELKSGDIINVVLFNQSVCTPIENYVVGRDNPSVFSKMINRLKPNGSTNLEAGVRQGYKLADASYQDNYTNRVLLITDALANTGVVNPEMISLISERYEKRRIRLSGIGVGREFNDKLLDRLTERGKGAYVFLGSSAEVDAVFGNRFVSLIETIANDVHFRLHLPPSLAMNVFYGEESSTVKEEVQAIHYFAGTEQLFLSDLAARGGQLRPQDSVMLSIEYNNPETDAPEVEEYAYRLQDIQGYSKNLRKGRLLMSFIDGLSDIARRHPSSASYRAGGWQDAGAVEQCRRGQDSLREQAAALDGDPEVRRVVELWDRFCSRYGVYSEPPHRDYHDTRPLPPRPAPPRPVPVPKPHPHQRRQPQGDDIWPSASR